MKHGPNRTWHDAPDFERMEAKVKALEIKLTSIERLEDDNAYLTGKLAALVDAAEEVVAISDRKHDARDSLKAAIKAAKVGL